MEKYWRATILEKRNGIRYHWFVITCGETEDDAVHNLTPFTEKGMKILSINNIDYQVGEKNFVVAGGWKIRVPADDYEIFTH
ncbi:MAG: hypothetical protein NC548_37035 [Lachnospiraceae bacterium]|nr:hypothetical protein [Lachnospiraceae bacterium]MCM1234646.1 hypothetical protein [Ruminococcus flavefaciens]